MQQLDSQTAIPSIDDSMRQRIEHDRVAMLFRTTGYASILTAIMAVLVLFVCYKIVPWPILASWLTIVLLLRLLTEYLGRQFLKERTGKHDALWWGWVYSAAVFPSALVWGMAVYFPGLDQNPAAEIFVSLCLVARMAGSLLTHCYFPPALYTSSVPLIGAMALRYWSVGSSESILAGVMWIVMLIYTLSIGHPQARLVASTIRLRYENENLIEELQQKNIDEAAARKKAEQANVAKSRFFAAANHDLRQPLHALGLFASTLRNTDLDGYKRQLVEQISQSIDSLESLFDDLLDMSRLDAGQVKVRLEHFDVGTLLDRIRNSYAPAALEKGLKLQVHPSSLTLFSDPALLFRILSNLVTNSIRYTHSGGILVGVRRLNDRVLLQVWDTGIGIPVDQQEKVFEEFYQLHNPERDRRKGLGLGLATVKRVTSLMGHALILQSKVGKGTVFSVEVPLGIEPQFQLPIKAPETVNAPDLLCGKTIAVIDDEASVRMGMLSLLQSWGCDCITAATAEEVLAELAGVQLDFIIADLRLGDQRSGIEAVRILRDTLQVNVPAVVLSGDTAAERIREVTSAGLTMLHKPLKAIRLRAVLNHEFARRNHVHQVA